MPKAHWEFKAKAFGAACQKARDELHLSAEAVGLAIWMPTARVHSIELCAYAKTLRVLEILNLANYYGLPLRTFFEQPLAAPATSPDDDGERNHHG